MTCSLLKGLSGGDEKPTLDKWLLSVSHQDYVHTTLANAVKMSYVHVRLRTVNIRKTANAGIKFQYICLSAGSLLH